MDGVSTTSKVLIVSKLSGISTLSRISTVSKLSGIVSKLLGILTISILSGISIVSKLLGSVSSKTKSIISFEVSLIVCELSLSKKPSSIQMSSVPTLF